MATDLATAVITPEQLAMMPNDKDFELVDGQLVDRKIGNKSNWVATRLARLLGDYVEEHQLGWVFTSEAGYRLDPSRPNNVRKPDVYFVQFGRLPDEEPADAYDYLAPDLAVEVISPGDTVRELDEKLAEYLTAGVREVWVVNPELRTAKIYESDGSITPLRESDDLEGGEIVPGFRCRLGTLMQLPKPPAETK